MDRVLGQEPNQYLSFLILAPLNPTPARSRPGPPTNLAPEKENLMDNGHGINKLSSPTHEGKTVFYFSVSNVAFGGYKMDAFGPILGLVEGTLD